MASQDRWIGKSFFIFQNGDKISKVGPKSRVDRVSRNTHMALCFAMVSKAEDLLFMYTHLLTFHHQCLAEGF